MATKDIRDFLPTLGKNDTITGLAVTPATALTAAAAAAPAGGTGATAGAYDTAENRDAAIATINNLRTRVNEIEALLKAHGFLPA